MRITKMDESWKVALKDQFEKEYFKKISSFLENEKHNGKIIYPSESLIFNAFNRTPFKKVKIIILGQDPYHGDNQAMGLSFSVPKEVRIPPSLKNIYKELHTDVGIDTPTHGDLIQWANQGVFLLNAMLTVEKEKAGSHQKIGWQNFTDSVIKTLSHQQDHLVFMLWGNFAKKKAGLIDGNKHLILEAAHPSPLARGAFFGCKHFSKANEYLTKYKKMPIDWSLD